MSERDEYPAGVPCWVDTLQPDVRTALDFYSAVFGWEFAGPGSMPFGGEYHLARVRGRDAAGIGSTVATSPDAAAVWNTYVRVDSAEAAAARAREAGGRVLHGPLDAPPAGRLAVLADPSGAPIAVWEAGSREGAQVVNEPSAWAMSMLHTADPDGARSFYGALFGWEAESFGDGIELWRRPGYVGGEPQQPVARDVVAAMMPADGPAHWGVNFWIDDADAAAERTESAGGSVVAAPHDTPGFRNAVLADPAGAVFTVSQLLLGP